MQLYNLFPGLLRWLPGPHNRIFANFEQLRRFVAKQVERHRLALDPNFPQDFIDCFLLRMEQVRVRAAGQTPARGGPAREGRAPVPAGPACAPHFPQCREARLVLADWYCWDPGVWVGTSRPGPSPDPAGMAVPPGLITGVSSQRWHLPQVGSKQ